MQRIFLFLNSRRMQRYFGSDAGTKLHSKNEKEMFFFVDSFCYQNKRGDKLMFLKH
jgi:hypothetical protein